MSVNDQGRVPRVEGCVFPCRASLRCQERVAALFRGVVLPNLPVFAEGTASAAGCVCVRHSARYTREVVSTSMSPMPPWSTLPAVRLTCPLGDGLFDQAGNRTPESALEAACTLPWSDLMFAFLFTQLE